MSTLNDLNYIKNIQAYPCTIPDGGLSLIVDAAFAAVIVGVMTFTRFDCDDILVERLRLGVKGEGPFGLRSPHDHSNKGHRNINVSGTQNWAPTINAGNTWFFDNIIVPARFIASGLFIYGIAVHSYALWTSMMYAGFNCDMPANSHSYSTTGPDGFIFIGPREQQIPLNGEKAGDCCFWGPEPVVIANAGCEVSCGFAAQWGPNPNDPLHPAAVTTWLEDDLGFKSAESTWHPGDAPGSGTIVHTGQRPTVPFSGNSIRLMLRMDTEGSVQLRASYFRGWCAGIPAHLLPAGGCPRGPGIA